MRLLPRTSIETTKWISFGAAILNCLAAGSVAVFALYAPQLQQHLHYTSLQVNAIGIAFQLGLYLTVPILGAICDTQGPRVIAAYASILALPAYYVASLAYAKHWPPSVLVVCYACLGSATVALYLSGLSTVAKNHPDSRGLSMAVVTSAFGLSSLWEAQVVDRLYRDRGGQIKVEAMYISFGLLLSLVGLFSACTLRNIDQIQPGDNGARVAAEYNSESDDEEANERSTLLTGSAILEPSDKLHLADRVRVFLKDHSSWLYFLA